LEGDDAPVLVIDDPEDFASVNNELTEGVGSIGYEEAVKKKITELEQQKAWRQYYANYYSSYYYNYSTYSGVPPNTSVNASTAGIARVDQTKGSAPKTKPEISPSNTKEQTKSTEIEKETTVVTLEETSKVFHPYGTWQKVQRKLGESKYGPKEIKEDELLKDFGEEEENPFRSKNTKKRKQLEQEPPPIINSIHYDDSSSDDEEKKITKKMEFFVKKDKTAETNGNSKDVIAHNNVNTKKLEIKEEEEAEATKKRKLEGGKIKFTLKKKN